MATTNLDHADLDAVLYGGAVREDVMNRIWDISDFPLPFTDLCGKGTHTNRRCEWTEDELATPATNNAVVDGADVSQNNTKTGLRVGNFTQIAVKEVQVSQLAEASNSIGGQGGLAYQIMQRQKELRRDVEAQMLTAQASVPGDGAAVAGISAGFFAQIKTNYNMGATGVIGGFNTATGLFVAPTPGTPRALSETTLRDVLQSVYQQGGNTSTLMARPPVIRKISEYMFSATARVATLTSDNRQAGQGPMTAYGSVNVFVTDFGQTIVLKDNRIQPVVSAGVSNIALLDAAHLSQSLMSGYKVEPLAKTGLAEKRLMSVSYSLKVLNEKSQGAIYDIDETAAMVA